MTSRPRNPDTKSTAPASRAFAPTHLGRFGRRDTGWVTMRRVGEAEAHELISWLDQPPWTSEIGTGYDREGWADSIWVLHAMFERDRVPDVTYEEIRRRAIDEGAKDPMAAWNENTPEEVIAAMRKASGGVIVLTADGLVDTGIRARIRQDTGTTVETTALGSVGRPPELHAGSRGRRAAELPLVP